MFKQPIVALVALLCATGNWASAAPLRGDQFLPGLPILEEPRHHVVFQNTFVRVYEVEVGPHQATLEHQHRYDNLFVVFGDANLTNKVVGRPEAKLRLQDLGVNFGRAPYSHVIQNNGDRPFRNVTLELLHPQGESERFYPSLDAAMAAASGRGKTVRQATVLQTQEMRLRAVSVSPGSSWSVPHDGHDRLLVLVDKIDNAGPRQKNSPFPAGMVVWIPANSDWNVYRAGSHDMKLMVLDFMDTNRKDTNGTVQRVSHESDSTQVR
jgi:hypothetical protein